MDSQKFRGEGWREKGKRGKRIRGERYKGGKLGEEEMERLKASGGMESGRREVTLTFLYSFAHRQDYRPTWNLNVTEPVAGNYYPVNSRIFMKVYCMPSLEQIVPKVTVTAFSDHIWAKRKWSLNGGGLLTEVDSQNLCNRTRHYFPYMEGRDHCSPTTEFT
jgi:hypothetical protein